MEASTDVKALVMEFVEGPTLADRIAAGAIPFDEALPIAAQIADALDAAHERGIIHRDLKPANIKVRPDGTVKVLDFGLAKNADTGASVAPTSAATMTSPAMTAMGMILGTASYMAPEQARGRQVDRRADIWAFGCVLYEMLTARRAFPGEEITDVIAAVITRDPDLTALPASTSDHVRALLARCFVKDPKQRLRDIGEARLQLLGGAESAVSRPTARQWWPWAVAATAVLALATGLAIVRPWMAAPVAPSLRVTMQTGFTGSFDNNLQNQFAMSADGGMLAFTVRPVSARTQFDAATSLYIRRLDQAAATPVAGTEGAAGPFFSPTGEWLGYFAKGKLFKVPVNGGAAVPLADAVMGRGAVWGDDDVITFTPGAAPGVGLMRISAGGGTPIPLGPMADTHVTQRWPQMLPGNQTVLYTGATTVDNFDDACLVVQTLDGAPPKVVQCGGSQWTYVHSGHVLYAHAGSVFAAPFDLATLAITGTGVPVLDSVRSSTVSGAAQFVVSRDGRLVYLARRAGSGREAPLDMVDRQGKATRLAGAPRSWSSLAFSPDGSRLAIDVSSTDARNIWVYDLARDAAQQATFGDVSDTSPIWRDDRVLTFASAAAGPPNLFAQRAEGGAPERLTTSPRLQFPGSWSPDGRQFAFTEIRDGQGDVVILHMDGTASTGVKPGKVVPFVASGARESHPAFSPDGQWLAFASNESKVLQVYVASATDPSRKWQISIDGGNQPMWSYTSRELIFRTEESASRLLYVTYDASGGTFTPSRPALWTPARFSLRSGVGDVALHPDGRRVVGTLSEDNGEVEPAQPLMTLITNFFAELTARVPAR